MVRKKVPFYFLMFSCLVILSSYVMQEERDTQRKAGRAQCSSIAEWQPPVLSSSLLHFWHRPFLWYRIIHLLYIVFVYTFVLLVLPSRPLLIVEMWNESLLKLWVFLISIRIHTHIILMWEQWDLISVGLSRLPERKGRTSPRHCVMQYWCSGR